MPLVVPGITGTDGGDPNEVWMNKLVGKTVTDDDHSETVCSPSFPTAHILRPEADPKRQNFCKKDLPEKSRVITPGTMVTRDFRPDRLNVHLKDDGTVSHVQHG